MKVNSLMQDHIDGTLPGEVLSCPTQVRPAPKKERESDKQAAIQAAHRIRES
jgi:hypothetical protein